MAVLIVDLVVAWGQVIVVVWNLGIRFDVMLAVVPLLGAVVLLIVGGRRLVS